jgi:hypothetical protein
MELAAEWGIEEYQSPAGGCLLTDPGFSRRLGELMDKVPDFDGEDAQLIKVGRLAWVGETLIVLGRRHDENERLMELALPTDLLLKERERPGPTALLRTYPRGTLPGEEDIEEAAGLLGTYGKGKAPLEPDEVVEIERGTGEERLENTGE